MVYVDTLLPCLKNKHWRFDKSCHLFADSVDELKTFAKGIGLKASWYQNHKRLPHFDLTANMRKKAVRHEAREVNERFVYEYITRGEKR
ncbi:hypothetical protein LCGC14_1114050 [marine sediment metagenome]|uniref:DUF4031 domain-containing protein n=1 Tax=marine sediment metagenome TaxID=412755 RepID=A0A0F9M600_9ZZZZ